MRGRDYRRHAVPPIPAGDRERMARLAGFDELEAVQYIVQASGRRGRARRWRLYILRRPRGGRS